ARSGRPDDRLRNPGEGHGSDSQHAQDSRIAAPHPNPLPAKAGRGSAGAADADRRGREVLMSEAMRPSAATAVWSERLAQPAVASSIAQAMDGVSVLEAPG